MDASSYLRPRLNEGLSSSGSVKPLEDTLRLSLSQREVWLDQRAWPDSPHLNIGGAAYLEGPMDLAVLRQAMVRMVGENEALRLAPLSTGRQVLLPAFERELEVVDLSASTDPRKAMRMWWQTRIRDQFALDGTPPWRFSLLRGSDELYGLSIQFHHLIMDGWGTTLVIRRWAEIYSELLKGIPATQTAAPGYTKFIAESHAYRDSKAYEDDAQYWRTQVPELPPQLIERRYGNGSPGGAVGTGLLPQSRLVEQRIARADYDRLEDHAGPAGLTPFNYVLAALALYFARVNNVPEVVVGVPSLNRSGRAYKGTMGMFAGVLAVKVPVHPEMRVDELLAATRLAMRGALRHPRYPLSDLGRELEVIRQGRDGLLDIFLSFERQDYAVHFGDTPFLGARQAFSGSARYPLGVTVCEFNKEHDLELILDASEACFAQGEPELLGRRLWHLVESMRANPEAGIAQLSIVPNEEQWAVLYGLHRDIATHEYPPPFIALFEHQVALRPEAPAVVWDEGSIDYATMNRRANLLAQRLIALGAGRDKVVAIAMARTCAMVVAMLAIAKTGAAFLPLDPDAPLERLADILEQSRACALLIDPAAGGRFGQLHPNIVRVRASEALAEAADPALPPLTAKPAPRDLAYVLFTSGSTGRPKGVMVEHAVLSRRLAWLSRAYGVDWRDCSGQSTQYTFDPSLIELLLPLINGGRVALPPPGRLLPESLAEFSVRHGVTFIAFVPTTLQRFLDAASGMPGLKLRVACCGGEVLSPALARRFVNETGARLFNVYGPTEASIFATAWQCTATATGADDDTPLPIGRPIDDTRIYVLDAQLRPMPLGIPGEIYIGGDTLARGYLHRPELDAAVFLDDPFQPGARMYKTGDRGWLGVEGNLHFVGRLDRQVKLRGYRIELGEIEAACMHVNGVGQAAARLVDVGGKPQIHAWVGAAGHVTAQRLQSVLRQRLPDYMIPSAICVLPRLNESSVGKIDYDALPGQQPGALAEPARLPGTALERELVAIWEGALPGRAIGVHDNFFDIGGDSLAAVAILSGIDGRLGCKVPMYTLTEHPTVERLAIALGKKITPPDMIIALSAENGRTPMYLAASGHGDLMRFTELAKLVSNKFDVYMLQPPIDGKLKDVTSLAELYVNCIVAQGREPGVVAGFSVGGVAALETARLLKSSGAPARLLVLLDTIHPRSIVGGVGSWRALGWLVRTLRIQELSMNGRRLGGLVGDPGLVAQVMALRGFQPGEFDGQTCLVRSSGLANWDRLFFGKWRRLMKDRLTERRVPGLHGSIFEANNIAELAAVLGSVMDERHAA